MELLTGWFSSCHGWMYEIIYSNSGIDLQLNVNFITMDFLWVKNSTLWGKQGEPRTYFNLEFDICRDESVKSGNDCLNDVEKKTCFLLFFFLLLYYWDIKHLTWKLCFRETYVVLFETSMCFFLYKRQKNVNSLFFKRLVVTMLYTYIKHIYIY